MPTTPTADRIQCVACRARLTQRDSLPAAPTAAARYVQCRRCGSMQLHPLPARETNQAFETEETALRMAAIDDRRLTYLRRRLALLCPPSSPPQPPATRPRLLDVGCSTGRLMGLASHSGWDPTGIEMSEPLAAEARRHQPGSTIKVGDIMQIDVTALPPFDAVVALDVIEHVLDPDEFLRRLHGLLRPGGQLLLQTPNVRSLRARLHGPRWNMLIPEYHFHLYSPKGLTLALERAGFSNIRTSTASGSGTETGAAAAAARAKELLLNQCALGNALVAITLR